MNCAWCSPSDEGTDGICDGCMLLYFNINPGSIHAEIAEEEKKTIVRLASLTSAATEEREVVNV